ncbi:MAG: hypothetical protein WCK53_10405 [Methanomicrobiales archaeon]
MTECLRSIRWGLGSGRPVNVNQAYNIEKPILGREITLLIEWDG